MNIAQDVDYSKKRFTALSDLKPTSKDLPITSLIYNMKITNMVTLSVSAKYVEIRLWSEIFRLSDRFLFSSVLSFWIKFWGFHIALSDVGHPQATWINVLCIQRTIAKKWQEYKEVM